MNQSADVVIVGGGLEGLSIAWSLSERDRTDVLVLERETLCSGMTARSSGIVRCHYGVRSLAAMARYGVEVFSHAEDLLGADVGYRRTGYVVGVDQVNVAALKANVSMHGELGIEVDLLGHSDVATLWPGVFLDDFAAFAYEPSGGHGDAYMTGMAFAKRARELGVRIQQNSKVAGLRQSTGGRITGVTLASGDVVNAGTIVLAAGPWSVDLAASVGVELPIRSQREQILLLDTGAAMGELPVFSDLVSLQYLRGETGGAVLFGNSDHSEPEFADPDNYANRADSDFIETAIDKLDHRLPSMPDPRITASYAGCYDVTPDFNPIIGWTDVPGMFVAAGFSGHGYKISPAVGRLVADLLVDGTGSDPAIAGKDFRLSRFTEGQPLVSAHPYVGAGEMR